MPFEREPSRPRSASDPTGARRGAGTPGKHTLTQDLIVRPPSAPPLAAAQGGAPLSPAMVPLPDSAPPSPRMVPLPDSAPPSPRMVPLPCSAAASVHDTASLHDAASLHGAASEHGDDDQIPALVHGAASEHGDDDTAASLHDAASVHGAASLHDAASVHGAASDHGDDDAAASVHDAASVHAAASDHGDDHVAAPAAVTGNRPADYYKSISYLTAAFGTLVSAIGWILLRQHPLIQPVGQALASGLKNGFGALDDGAKGNKPKALGQTISAVGQGVAMSGVIASSKQPGSQIVGTRAAGAGLNGAGMVFTGIGEAQGGNPAKAASNFVAAALNLIGVVGYTVEAANSAKPAFLALEGVNNFNNSATPIGGAIDDGRKSQIARPWLKDPKVLGQEVADLGLALSAIASTLNKIYLTKDKEEGTSDSQRWATLIMALGAVGMFLATAGYGISAMAELPKKRRTDDVELAPTAPPAP